MSSPRGCSKVLHSQRMFSAGNFHQFSCCNVLWKESRWWFLLKFLDRFLFPMSGSPFRGANLGLCCSFRVLVYVDDGRVLYCLSQFVRQGHIFVIVCNVGYVLDCCPFICLLFLLPGFRIRTVTNGKVDFKVVLQGYYIYTGPNWWVPVKVQHLNRKRFGEFERMKSYVAVFVYDIV